MVVSWITLLILSGLMLLTGASFFFDYVTSFPAPADKSAKASLHDIAAWWRRCPT
jgi:hypothetical protein